MNEAKATRYHRRRRRAEMWAWLSAGATLTVAACSPFGAWLRDWCHRFSFAFPVLVQPVVAHVTFTGVILVLGLAAAVPGLAYRSRQLDEQYRGSESAESTWDAVVPVILIAAVAGLAIGGLVRAAAWIAGGWWWLLAGAALSAALLLAMRMGPAAFGRLDSVKPLNHPDLTSRLTALANDAGVPISGIDEWGGGEGVGASALITGIGRNRRVLLSSELLRGWSDDEVVVVVAHELGHHARHDLLRAALLNAVLVTLSLSVAAGVLRLAGPWLALGTAADLAALPLVALVAGASWLLLTPLRHAQSRRQERRADTFALARTGAAEAFGAAVRRLGASRLSEEKPSLLTTWLFHGHPSVAERLAVAERYRQDGARRRA